MQTQQNEAYFHGQMRNYLQQQSDEQIVDRLRNIRAIADQLGTSDVWDLVLQDAKRWKQKMDDEWQNVVDDKVLSQMRIVKQAYLFLTQVPERYKREAKMLEDEIKSRKDYENTVEDI